MSNEWRSFFVRNLVMLFGIVVLLAGTAAVHCIRYDRSRFEEAVVSVARATGMARPAWGAAWYEGRLLRPDEALAQPAYPELLAPDRREFVYAH
jgi:hypothetical protein